MQVFVYYYHRPLWFNYLVKRASNGLTYTFVVFRLFKLLFVTPLPHSIYHLALKNPNLLTIHHHHHKPKQCPPRNPQVKMLLKKLKTNSVYTIAGFDPKSFWEQHIGWGDQDAFQNPVSPAQLSYEWKFQIENILDMSITYDMVSSLFPNAFLYMNLTGILSFSSFLRIGKVSPSTDSIKWLRVTVG